MTTQDTSERLSTLPHLALSAHAHNREGLRRTDDAWLAERWADASTRVLVVAGNRIRPVDGIIEWVAPADAPDGVRVLLGERDGVTRFALICDPATAPGEREEWVGLRGLFPHFVDGGADDAPWLFHAIGLAEWHWVTRFCPRCGGGLTSSHAGHELVCTSCGRAQFPRTDPAVIMAVTLGEPGAADERVLLGRQQAWPAGRWSTLAGFVEPGETFEDAVRREVMEEVGTPVGEVTYFGNQPWPLPASLMVGFLARATSDRIDVDGAEIEEARWFTRAELLADAASGAITVPKGVSISSSLLESWAGESLHGGW
ncbi:NAD(+) diphosphatase [Nocardioides sp. LHG3406-4]|uniref:NAD(+) diphosphatase n=1 Tax=Nocardioides sp. LHG3406-4 TaxID=2804575 RepID=UPI003CF30A16